MLTELEQRVFDCVKEHINRQGRAPTIAEIAEALGHRSRGTIHRYVQALVEKEYLSQARRGWRGLQLGPAADADDLAAYEIPLLGTIAAGRPIEAIPGESRFSLAEFFVGPTRYALRVTGESMIDAGIFDGDTVIIDKSLTAKRGDIVVALIDRSEATLKTLGKHDRFMVELIPENKRMAPMQYAAARVELQGVLVAMLRNYR